MKYKLLLLVVIVIVLVMSGCIGNSNTAKGSPRITAMKSNDTTVTVFLVDLNGAKEVKGLHVDSPAISSPDVIPAGTDVPVGKQIKITDPALAGKVNISISSSVDGAKQTVLNGTL